MIKYNLVCKCGETFVSWFSSSAEFDSLCKKNFGCSHFIVGRDHTGVGSFYPTDAAKRLFVELGDIGIQPIFF